jgi:nucleotide-binding universal stress UspA family protein
MTVGGTINRILVGVDGSDNARKALEWAILLGSTLDAEIVAVYAVGLLTDLGDGVEVPSHTHLAEIRERFESDWCSPLLESGRAHRLLCLDGPPSLVLVRAATDETADLIVVGTRGAGGLTELVLGSTSLHLLEHAGRPVLIVPPASGTRPDRDQ